METIVLNHGELQNLKTISRLEVVTTNGREMIKYFEPGTVNLSLQDQGRTLKVFLIEPSVPGWRYNGKEFTVSDLRVIAKLHDNMFAYGTNPTTHEVVYTLNVLRQEGLPFDEYEEAVESETEAVNT